MLVDLDLWVINVRYVTQWYYVFLSAIRPVSDAHVVYTSILDDYTSDPDSCVCCHLYWPQPPSQEALSPQF